MKLNKAKLYSLYTDRKLLGYRILLVYKRAYQRAFEAPEKHQLLFVVGCQRSGTTLICRIFNRDLRSNVYTAFSELSSRDPNRLRLNPLDEVEKELRRNRGHLIIMKPIVESQNTISLLNFFENSKALWMFRNYKDVVSSNIRRFGHKNGINDLRPIVENQPDDWRADKVSEHTRELVLKFFSEQMNVYDAAALFWLVRNRLFFELGLDSHPRVMTCNYDDLVTCPEFVMKDLYRFLRARFPGRRILWEIKPTSVGKGRSISLSHEVEMLCLDLYKRLQEAHRSKLHRILSP